MEKNVGSVDLEELKRAREELNRERGIENDPNMYSNYNPNRSDEEQSSSENGANATETEPNSVVENAAQAEYSEQSNPTEYGAVSDVQSAEPEANYGTAYSEETGEATSESASSFDADQTAATEEYSSETSNASETYENSAQYTSETSTPYAEEASETDATAQADEPSLDEQTSSDSLQTDDVSTEADDLEDEEADNEILKALFGDDYQEIKDTMLNSMNEQDKAQENSETDETDSQADSTTSQSADSTAQAETQEQSPVAESSEFAVNDDEYRQILGDEKTENAMRVTLPNLNQEDVARNNFNAYDNFAQFEVHYTPPAVEEPENMVEEEERGADDEFASEIKNILYGTDGGNGQNPEQMSGGEEQSNRSRNYQTEEKPDSPTAFVDMASHTQTNEPTPEYTGENEEEDDIDREYNEIRAEQGDFEDEENGTMSHIVSEKINDSEENSLSNAVEDNQNTSNLDETESAPETVNDETVESVEYPSESQETESDLKDVENTESVETAPETANQEETSTEQEAEYTPSYVRNPEFDELPEHDYASEDVISRENESYITTTSVNYADLNRMYESSTAKTSNEAQQSEAETSALKETETTASEENSTAETVENSEAAGTDATAESDATADNGSEASAEAADDETADDDIELDDSIISFSSGTEEEGSESASAVEVENSAESAEADEDGQTKSAPHKTFAQIEEYSYIDAMVDDTFKDSGKYSLLLGKKESGEYEFATIEKGYNLAIFGDTASETYLNLISSAVLSLMLKNTSEEVKFLICDADPNTKLGGLCKNTFVSGSQVYTEKESILENLMAMSKELDERYKMLAKVRVRSVEDYNKLAAEIGTSLLPYKVVVLSNFQDMSNFDNIKEINALLFNLLKFGRIVGIYLVIGSSKPILSNEINYNLPSRISLKTADEMQSTAFVGSADASYLEDENDVIFSKIDSEAKHLKVAKLSKNELKLILQNIED